MTNQELVIKLRAPSGALSRQVLRPRIACMTAEIRNRAIATKKISLAIETAVPAIPPKPRTAATSATTRKRIAQESIVTSKINITIAQRQKKKIVPQFLKIAVSVFSQKQFQGNGTNSASTSFS
jgi:hypothetical protein